MAKRCPHCGHVIEDEEKLFCPSCGELIDRKISDNLKLLNEIDKTLDDYKQSQSTNYNKSKKQTPQNINTTQRRRNDDDDYIPIKKSVPPKKSSNSMLILIIIIIVVVILKFLLF